MHKGRLLIALSLLAMALPVMAQTGQRPQPACPATPAALPKDLASWRSPIQTGAATDADGAAATGLVMGQAIDLDLFPTPQVKYAVLPERPGAPASHGGLAMFQIDEAGVYRIAIDNAAWLDVVSDGKALASVRHGHGPDCSGIRKMVDFKLEPGIYVLQMAGSSGPTLRVLLMRAPAG